MSPEEYVTFAKELAVKFDALVKLRTDAYETTRGHRPVAMRPITPDDIVPGKIVYGKNEEGWYWHQIEQVHNPRDEFKAYSASDGCKYGLNGHFVRSEV